MYTFKTMLNLKVIFICLLDFEPPPYIQLNIFDLSLIPEREKLSLKI